MAEENPPSAPRDKARRPRFSSEEDSIIMANYKDKDTNWNHIASLCNGRTAKQVYDRYKAYLDPNINKGPWTEEEYNTLTMICNTTGTNWKYIRKFFPGRTIYNIKNAFQILCNHGTLNKEQCQAIPKQLDDQLLNMMMKQPGMKPIPGLKTNDAPSGNDQIVIPDELANPTESNLATPSAENQEVQHTSDSAAIGEQL